MHGKIYSWRLSYTTFFLVVPELKKRYLHELYRLLKQPTLIGDYGHQVPEHISQVHVQCRGRYTKFPSKLKAAWCQLDFKCLYKGKLKFV